MNHIRTEKPPQNRHTPKSPYQTLRCRLTLIIVIIGLVVIGISVGSQTVSASPLDSSSEQTVSNYVSDSQTGYVLEPVTVDDEDYFVVIIRNSG